MWDSDVIAEQTDHVVESLFDPLTMVWSLTMPVRVTRRVPKRTRNPRRSESGPVAVSLLKSLALRSLRRRLAPVNMFLLLEQLAVVTD